MRGPFRSMWLGPGSTSPGSYAVSAMSGHYQWAYGLIRKWVKTREG